MVCNIHEGLGRAVNFTEKHMNSAHCQAGTQSTHMGGRSVLQTTLCPLLKISLFFILCCQECNTSANPKPSDSPSRNLSNYPPPPPCPSPPLSPRHPPGLCANPRIYWPPPLSNPHSVCSQIRHKSQPPPSDYSLRASWSLSSMSSTHAVITLCFLT